MYEKLILQDSKIKASNFSSSPLVDGKIQNLMDQNKEYLASYVCTKSKQLF